MSFWTKTMLAGMEAVGIDPQEFGVNQPRKQPQQPQQQQHHHQPPGHGGHGQPPQAQAQAQAFIAPDDEKGREMERLRKELRKVEEKTEFFKKQVVTLQQQVNQLDPHAALSITNTASAP